jgi:hypothetical protein
VRQLEKKELNIIHRRRWSSGVTRSDSDDDSVSSSVTVRLCFDTLNEDEIILRRADHTSITRPPIIAGTSESFLKPSESAGTLARGRCHRLIFCGMVLDSRSERALQAESSDGSRCRSWAFCRRRHTHLRSGPS